MNLGTLILGLSLYTWGKFGLNWMNHSRVIAGWIALTTPTEVCWPVMLKTIPNISNQTCGRCLQSSKLSIYQVWWSLDEKYRIGNQKHVWQKIQKLKKHFRIIHWIHRHWNVSSMPHCCQDISQNVWQYLLAHFPLHGGAVTTIFDYVNHWSMSELFTKVQSCSLYSFWDIHQVSSCFTHFQ